jgi:hypothetical protein
MGVSIRYEYYATGARAHNADMYGMLVHSCFVQDQAGNRILVLDEKG